MSGLGLRSSMPIYRMEDLHADAELLFTPTSIDPIDHNGLRWLTVRLTRTLVRYRYEESYDRKFILDFHSILVLLIENRHRIDSALRADIALMLNRDLKGLAFDWEVSPRIESRLRHQIKRFAR